ncbi:MAG: tRNA guanosine(34) transglycosylase Tgt [Candidatus Levybacteria bacterium]|nr:tRNA guanosine(34) transglycosylase Tgt [Candidatus Levybacteria bacterium]
MFNFKVHANDKKSKARLGKITTYHGIIDTPSFVAVGTQGTVKGLAPQDLKETGVQILFGNTYHLHLRPGEDLVKEFGGLGKFMSWYGPTITDSGGFQVFSLGRGKTLIRTRNNAEDFSLVQHVVPQGSAPLVKIAEEGVVFRSHIDGSLHTFTPEKSIEIQKKLGADIVLAFDECAPHPSSFGYTKQAMERTHRWALRSLGVSQGKQYYPWKQALYGIVQGGVYKDLRKESARFISSLPFNGIAIGGVSVGESKKEMRNVLDWVMPLLPDNKPIHLLGIGEIDDIFDAIEKGVDTFDCVIPTRFGRYGIVFVHPPQGNLKNRFRIDINKTKFSKDKGPLSKDCVCYTCKTFTRAYIHHLFRAGELLAYRLASYHNMFFINNLVKKIRGAILEEGFEEIKEKWMK